MNQEYYAVLGLEQSQAVSVSVIITTPDCLRDEGNNEHDRTPDGQFIRQLYDILAMAPLHSFVERVSAVWHSGYMVVPVNLECLNSPRYLCIQSA
jgi:hypothetical protein